jgi:adenosylcobinamide-GDP ribazoletransferase
MVGVLIGLFPVSVAYIFSSMSSPVTAALVLISSAAVTGAIHLDGFADTCDGFSGTRSREKILEIMRDSRVGTMGVVGVACLLLLKFAMLSGMTWGILWRSLILAAVFARWSQALSCYTSGYARQEGKARYFIEYAGRKEVVAGMLFTLAVFFLLLGLSGLLLFFVCILPVFLSIQFVKRKIGGMTGDTIGTVSEIAEVSVLFFTLMYA